MTAQGATRVRALCSTRLGYAAIICLVAVAGGCKKRRPSGSAAGERTIEQLGLKVKLPAGGKIIAEPQAPGWARVQVGRCSVLIELLQGPEDRSFDYAVKLATEGNAVRVLRDGQKIYAESSRATRWIRKQKLPDGYVLEYEGKGVRGRRMHEVVVRRQIGKRHILCRAHALSKSSDCVENICRAFRRAAQN